MEVGPRAGWKTLSERNGKKTSGKTSSNVSSGIFKPTSAISQGRRGVLCEGKLGLENSAAWFLAPPLTSSVS